MHWMLEYVSWSKNAIISSAALVMCQTLENCLSPIGSSYLTHLRCLHYFPHFPYSHYSHYVCHLFGCRTGSLSLRASLSITLLSLLALLFSPIGVSYWQTRTSKTPSPTSYSGPAKQLFLHNRWWKGRKIRFWLFAKFWDCLLIIATKPSKLESLILYVWKKRFLFG